MIAIICYPGTITDKFPISLCALLFHNLVKYLIGNIPNVDFRLFNHVSAVVSIVPTNPHGMHELMLVNL